MTRQHQVAESIPVEIQGRSHDHPVGDAHGHVVSDIRQQIDAGSVPIRDAEIWVPVAINITDVGEREAEICLPLPNQIRGAPTINSENPSPSRSSRRRPTSTYLTSDQFEHPAALRARTRQ